MTKNNVDIENDQRHAEALARTGFWGVMAAGLLFLAKDTGRLGIAERSELVLEPLTYGTMGGAGNPGESPEEVAIREGGREETGYYGSIEMLPLAVFESQNGFKYFNFLGIVEKEFNPTLNWENRSFVWIDSLDSLPAPLHPGMSYLLDKSKHIIETEMSKYLPHDSAYLARARQAIDSIHQDEDLISKRQAAKPRS